MMPTDCRLVGSALAVSTSRASALLVTTSLAVGVTLAAQQPRITNGRVVGQPAHPRRGDVLALAVQDPRAVELLGEILK